MASRADAESVPLRVASLPCCIRAAGTNCENFAFRSARFCALALSLARSKMKFFASRGEEQLCTSATAPLRRRAFLQQGRIATISRFEREHRAAAAAAFDLLESSAHRVRIRTLTLAARLVRLRTCCAQISTLREIQGESRRTLRFCCSASNAATAQRPCHFV